MLAALLLLSAFAGESSLVVLSVKHAWGHAAEFDRLEDTAGLAGGALWALAHAVLLARASVGRGRSTTQLEADGRLQYGSSAPPEPEPRRDDDEQPQLRPRPAGSPRPRPAVSPAVSPTKRRGARRRARDSAAEEGS